MKRINMTLEIDNDIPDLIFSDAKRLKQIIFNLIGNAIKFTEKGSIKLRICELVRSSSSVNRSERFSYSQSIAEADEDNKSLKFTVSDTGIGIKA